LAVGRAAQSQGRDGGQKSFMYTPWRVYLPWGKKTSWPDSIALPGQDAFYEGVLWY